jgi:hypothetical protein
MGGDNGKARHQDQAQKGTCGDNEEDFAIMWADLLILDQENKLEEKDTILQ